MSNSRQESITCYFKLQHAPPPQPSATTTGNSTNTTQQSSTFADMLLNVPTMRSVTLVQIAKYKEADRSWTKELSNKRKAARHAWKKRAAIRAAIRGLQFEMDSGLY